MYCQTKWSVWNSNFRRHQQSALHFITTYNRQIGIAAYKDRGIDREDEKKEREREREETALCEPVRTNYLKFWLLILLGSSGT
jgi:hypothetical protein